MPDNTRFGISFFGFTKGDVNAYVEKMLREFEEKLKEKDEEIGMLKNQCRDVKQKYEEIIKKSDKISEDRATIAEVLIKAQQKADTIITEAKNRAVEEKKLLDEAIEMEKEKFVDIKYELNELKREMLSNLRQFETQIVQIVDKQIEKKLDHMTEPEPGPETEQKVEKQCEDVVEDNQETKSIPFALTY